MPEPTLFQFRSSHYNEKARWALDRKRVAHRRRTLLPGFHASTARKLTGATQVPILVYGDRAIADSTRIIAFLEEQHPLPALYPEDPVRRQRALELEDYFDEKVGPFVRHAMFCLMIDHPGFVASLFAGAKGKLARGAYAAVITTQRRRMVAAMKLVPEAFEVSCKRIEEGFSRLEAEIQPSGHLVGDSFGVADLSAASLLSILVFPDEYPHPPVVAPPPRIREFWDGYAGRAGTEWVREMYRSHRGRSAATAE